MPDPIIPEPNAQWKEIIAAVKELVIVVGAVAGAIFAGVAQCQGQKNGEAIQVTTQKVDAAADKAVEVKDALDVQTAKVDKAQTMRATGDEATQEANILYFQRVLEDPDASDAQRAKATDGLAKAKAALAELKTKNGKKP